MGTHETADMGKAYEAAALAVASSALTPAWWKATDKPLSCATDVAKDALGAAVPDVLDAYAAKAYNDAMAMSHGYMEGDYETPKAAWEWLRAEAARLREGSNG